MQEQEETEKKKRKEKKRNMETRTSRQQKAYWFVARLPSFSDSIPPSATGVANERDSSAFERARNTFSLHPTPQSGGRCDFL